MADRESVLAASRTEGGGGRTRSLLKLSPSSSPFLFLGSAKFMYSALSRFEPSLGKREKEKER